MGSFDSDCWNSCAVPASVPLIVVGIWMRAIAASISSAASPSDLPGCKLKEIVDATNNPW